MVPRGGELHPGSVQYGLAPKTSHLAACQEDFRKMPLLGTWRHQRGVMVLPLSSGPSNALSLRGESRTLGPVPQQLKDDVVTSGDPVAWRGAALMRPRVCISGCACRSRLLPGVPDGR